MDFDTSYENSSFSVPIPRIFYSSFNNAPFCECSICKSNLLKEDSHYFIEKIFQDNKVVFEYALCEICRDSMGGEISFDSMMNLTEYFMTHGNLAERNQELMQSFDNSIKLWINKCVFTDLKREECSSYQICADCCGKNLIVSHLPLMVSSKATEEINSILSKETKENFDRFKNEVLNPPVNLKNIPILL